MNTLDEAKVNTRAETVEDILLKVRELEKSGGQGWDGRMARSIRRNIERLISK
jgi:hypothetical protein